MDPDITLAVIVNAAVAGDSLALQYAAEDLANWLSNGGFPPDRKKLIHNITREEDL